jgi:hypothetical protein
MNLNYFNGSARRVVLVSCASIGIVALVGLVSNRAGHNDSLLREARLLSGALNTYQADPSKFSDFPIQYVNNKSGAIIPINRLVNVSNQLLLATLAWTNSCLGDGALIITTNRTFIWLGTNGNVRQLDIPDFRDVPYSWYLKGH